jgi:hypothetical protein
MSRVLFIKKYKYFFCCFWDGPLGGRSTPKGHGGGFGHPRTTEWGWSTPPHGPWGWIGHPQWPYQFFFLKKKLFGWLGVAGAPPTATVWPWGGFGHPRPAGLGWPNMAKRWPLGVVRLPQGPSQKKKFYFVFF